jgi:hypothetical protein
MGYDQTDQTTTSFHLFVSWPCCCLIVVIAVVVALVFRSRRP